jgi:hypothetical protein
MRDGTFCTPRCAASRESLGADRMDFCVGGKGARGTRVEAILQVCHHGVWLCYKEARQI